MTPHHRTFDGSAALELATSLSGAAGATWFARHGREIVAESSLRVFADRARGSGLEMLRIWHTAAAIEHTAGSGGQVVVLIQVEGEARIRLPGRDPVTTLAPGRAALLRGDVPFTLTSDTATARIELRLDHPSPTLFDGELATWEEQSYLRVLLATVNAALSPPAIDPREAGFAHLEAAIRNLLSAGAASSAATGAGRLRGEEAALFRRAQAIIERDSVKPDFQVSSLAAQLSVSRVYLHRVFARAETTPSKEIRRVRVHNTRRHLRDPRNSRSREDLSRVARAAGFSSVRRMREALAAWDEHDEPRSASD